MNTVTLSQAARARRAVRVLVVDDNRDAVQTLGILLRSEGYIVHLARNGDEALTTAGAFRVDVVLLDLQMPGRSGFEVAQELHRRYRTNCPVLIAVTGHADTEGRARTMGFHHFVAKPYDAQGLLHLVGSLRRTIN